MDTKDYALCALSLSTMEARRQSSIIRVRISDNIEYEKKNELDLFKEKVNSFKEILNDRETKIYEILSEE